MEIAEEGNLLLNIYEDKEMQEFLEDDKGFNINPNYQFHGIETRSHMIISGPTKSGKTNFVTRLLQIMDRTFTEVLIYAPTIAQPAYRRLKKNGANVFLLDELQPHTSMEQKHNKIIVFDDFLTCKNKYIHNLIYDYAISGRHAGFSCIFLIQNYTSLNLEIRNQCEYIVLLKNTNVENLKSILRKSSCSVDRKLLASIVEGITAKKFQVCIIDSNAIAKYRIRQNFNNIINLDETQKQNKVIFYPKVFEKKTGKQIINVKTDLHPSKKQISHNPIHETYDEMDDKNTPLLDNKNTKKKIIKLKQINKNRKKK